MPPARPAASIATTRGHLPSASSTSTLRWGHKSRGRGRDLPRPTDAPPHIPRIDLSVRFSQHRAASVADDHNGHHMEKFDLVATALALPTLNPPPLVSAGLDSGPPSESEGESEPALPHVLGGQLDDALFRQRQRRHGGPGRTECYQAAGRPRSGSARVVERGRGHRVCTRRTCGRICRCSSSASSTSRRSTERCRKRRLARYL